MARRIREKRVFLYWFLPVVCLGIWGLTFCRANYFTCTVSLAPEELRAADGNRVLTLQRPENYDLGLAQTYSAINPEDFDQIISSTTFLCKILETPVMTKDSTFTGTYYSYLALEHRPPMHTIVMRAIRGKKRAQVGEILPPLDPFYPRSHASDALNVARKQITCETDRRTYLTTIDVVAQDPLVAALVAQAVIEHLELFASDNYMSKLQHMYTRLQEHIHSTYLSYEEALEQGDNARAAMLLDACSSFERQAIVLDAQMQRPRMFSVLTNASVPTEKTGPHHILSAIAGTFVIALFALLWICRRELFGMSHS